MSSNIDPITGLPDGYIDPLSYQIPLNSQPVLAPEWQPQGKIPQTLFPDNIPAFFATLQAMNGSNPSVVQALRTHPDTQAVEVYDLAGGGSSGGGVVATKTFQTNWDFTSTAIHSPLNIERVCSFMFSAFIDTPVSNPNRNQDIIYWLATPTSTSPRCILGTGNFNVGADIDNPINSSIMFNHDFANPLDPCAILGLPSGSDLALYGSTFGWATGFSQLVLHYT